jgi:4-amino-4-deoxy-L-arabinose transferase-like glycosyltransferase
MTSRSANRDLLWILALQLVLVLPFIGQPIHIDDPIFLDIGRNALSHPWHAHDFPYIFEGRLIPDMASHSHPPFVGYWIGLLLRLFGDGTNVHEKLHLGFVVFPLLFAVGMYRLSRRFTAFPALVTTLAICSPAAIVASHTLMTDYPCLAFSVFGVALYVEGVDSGKPRKVWMSALFLA